ncbi:MAG: RsmG family class I SAM-dependent methyltransferase [Armatimonadota bacterium]
MKHKAGETHLDPASVLPLVHEALGAVMPTGRLNSWDVCERLAALATELSTSGHTLGLTGYSTPETVLSRLMAPSLVLLSWLSPVQSLRVVEVGSGSGALGLTLAVLAPRWHITLLDRRSRATTFAEILALRLRLSNVAAVTGDASHPPPDLQPGHAALFRAVGSLAADLQLAQRVTLPRGLAVIWTSPEAPAPSTSLWRPVGNRLLPALGLSVRAFTRNRED